MRPPPKQLDLWLEKAVGEAAFFISREDSIEGPLVAGARTR